MDLGHTAANSEIYRVTGTLPAERIEALLELDSVDLSGVIVHIQEARGSFPGEDSLASIIEDLTALAKHMRGENQKELRSIIERADSLQSELARDAEYGLEELTKAETELNSAI